MQLPPSGPLWNLRLFRGVSLVFFLVPLVVTLLFVGAGRFPEAAASAISTLIFGCTWQFARHFTAAMERWVRRPGHRQGGCLPDHPASEMADPR
jgi:hypothetical protein